MSSTVSTEKSLNSSQSGFLAWLDARLPVTATFERHLSKHFVPIKTNFWYLFGALASITLILQFVTGIWLTMSYIPSAEKAFASVEYIMRDVSFGWLIRYMHSTGASALFLVVYLHMFRGLLYGSYKAPRELVWIFGMGIYLVMIMEGFTGYVLPWGQMSYWAAQVIVSLFGSVPFVGEGLVDWVRGDFLISGITLNRFFALHVVVLPILFFVLFFLHILAIHEVGGGNPDGEDIEAEVDENEVPVQGIPFFPHKVVKASFAITLFLGVFFLIAFMAPTGGGYFLEAANFEPANPLSTPEHIVPVWYYMPFYAMLRACTYPFLGLDSKFWGLVVMAAALAVLFVVPWLDRSKVASMRQKGNLSRGFLALFCVSFLALGYLGSVPTTAAKTLLAQFFTLTYFAYFVLMPWYSRAEKVRLKPAAKPSLASA